jgi:hypothetical protein
MGNDRDYGDNISTKLTFFLVGAGIGAVLALLFAPKSGEELRNDIADATRKGIDRSREAAEQLGTKATSTMTPRAPKRARFMTPRVRRPANITKPLVNARLSSTIPRPQKRARLLRQRAVLRCVRRVRFRQQLRRERKLT